MNLPAGASKYIETGKIITDMNLGALYFKLQLYTEFNLYVSPTKKFRKSTLAYSSQGLPETNFLLKKSIS